LRLDATMIVGPCTRGWQAAEILRELRATGAPQ
jgi:hypothetical protein